MNLEATLKTAILNLRSDSLEREEDVKVAVILPILNELGWNHADPGSLKPEYPAGPGRVDYALLCHGRPQVFIEAKRRGGLDVQAETQLFGYAANNGVPLLVLSDGLYWDFYLSMADGPPEERRFHRLELRDQDRVRQYAETLETFLRKRQVASGEARRNAENRLEGDRSRKRARDAMPDAWNALLDEPDELLCELLADKVQTRTGVEPQRPDVEEFLQRLKVARTFSMSADRPAKRRPGRFSKEEPQGKAADTTVPQSGSGSGHWQNTIDEPSLVSSIDSGEGEEGIQDIVRDLMRIVLEDFPETLDEQQISYLETTKNPHGLKIGSLALVRRISNGPKIGQRNRYWVQPLAGRWYVCSQWWKKDHQHNARALSTWVESLVAGIEDAGAKDRLLDIHSRLSVHVE